MKSTNTKKLNYRVKIACFGLNSVEISRSNNPHRFDFDLGLKRVDCVEKSVCSLKVVSSDLMNRFSQKRSQHWSKTQSTSAK
jgi:hypothetical protein